jgi:hypothetical protein
MTFFEGTFTGIHSVTMEQQIPYSQFFQMWIHLKVDRHIDQKYWGNEDTMFLSSVVLQRPIVDVICCETGYINVGVIYPGTSNNRHDVTDQLETFVFPTNAVFVYYANEHYDALIPTTQQTSRNNNKSA